MRKTDTVDISSQRCGRLRECHRFFVLWGEIFGGSRLHAFCDDTHVATFDACC